MLEDWCRAKPVTRRLQGDPKKVEEMLDTGFCSQGVLGGKVMKVQETTTEVSKKTNAY